VFDRNRVRVQIEQHQVLVVPGFGQTVVEHQLLVHRDVVPAKRIEVTHAVVGDGVEYVELILGCKRLAGICNLNVAGQIADTSQALTPEDQFNIFYTITNNSVSYLNALRRDDIAVYKQLMFNDSLPEARYDQDLM